MSAVNPMLLISLKELKAKIQQLDKKITIYREAYRDEDIIKFEGGKNNSTFYLKKRRKAEALRGQLLAQAVAIENTQTNGAAQPQDPSQARVIVANKPI